MPKNYARLQKFNIKRGKYKTHIIVTSIFTISQRKLHIEKEKLLI